MAKPSTSVYFAFNRDTSGELIWNDITNYVRGVDFGRAKSNELDVFAPGDCSITLDNRSRVFEPEYASSAFYGQIEPNGQVKIVSGGLTLFIGRIVNWMFDYAEKSYDATATINAVDLLSALGNIDFSTDITVPLELSGNRVKGLVTDASIGWSDPLFISPGDRWMASDTVITGDNLLDYLQKVCANDGASLYCRRDGLLAYQDTSFSNDAGLTNYRYNLALNSGLAVAPTGTISSGTGWYDGTRSSTWAYEGTASYTTTTTGGGFYVGYSEVDATKYVINQPYNISFYIKAGTSAVDLNIVYGLQNSSSVPLPGQSNYITLSLAANEVRRVDLGVSKTTMVSVAGIYVSWNKADRVSANNAFYVDALLIEKTTSMQKYFDNNSTYVAPAGQTYAFSNTGTANLSTSVWATTVTPNVDFNTPIVLSDSGAGIRFNDLTVSYASDQLTNQVTVDSAVFAFAEPVNDFVGQSKYGLKPTVIDSLLEYDTDAATLADYLLASNKFPEYRVESVSIVLNNKTNSEQTTLLGIDLFQPITLNFTPGGVGSQVSKTYQVTGVNHSVDLNEHRMDLKLVSLTNKSFRLDSPYLGVLDTNRLG